MHDKGPAFSTEPLQHPSSQQLEDALSLLVDELIAFRRRRDRRKTATGKLEIISVGALANTPDDTLEARGWVQAPVDLALKHAMREIAQLIFNRGRSAKLWTAPRLSILDSALNGVGKGHQIWYS